MSGILRKKRLKLYSKGTSVLVTSLLDSSQVYFGSFAAAAGALFCQKLHSSSVASKLQSFTSERRRSRIEVGNSASSRISRALPKFVVLPSTDRLKLCSVVTRILHFAVVILHLLWRNLGRSWTRFHV